MLLTVAASAERPNIILILADDMGPGEPSHMGGLIPTPALDKMADEGMRFTDAHTSSSVCTPTRYGILTGRYNWRSRLKSGVLVSVDSPALMDPKRLMGKLNSVARPKVSASHSNKGNRVVRDVRSASAAHSRMAPNPSSVGIE